jgi:glycosyltransferase involved in cell wall biosynthesis
MTPLRALVFAYACDPKSGSEGAAGWGVVRAIARFADAVVLVGPEHEHAIREWQESHPLDQTVFVTVPEPWWARLVPRTRVGWFLRYLGWLPRARACALSLDPRTFDVAWHATYSAYWLPTPAATLGLPCVWGPVGGGVTTPPTLWPALTLLGKLNELVDMTAVRAIAWLPQTRRTWRNVAVAIVQNEETLSRLPASIRHRAIILNHALLTERIDSVSEPRGSAVVFAGNLESRKAPSLAIRALAHADKAVRLVMIGTGVELSYLKRLAERLGVRDRVTFAGRLPRREVLRAWQTAAAGIFTGLREEGGIALAEAMLAGTPVIVLAHGGARMVAEAATDPERVALIAPASVDTTVRSLGNAMSRYVLYPSAQHGALLDTQRAARQLQTIATGMLATRSSYIAPRAVSEAAARG